MQNRIDFLQLFSKASFKDPVLDNVPRVYPKAQGSYGEETRRRQQAIRRLKQTQLARVFN